jgi:hypothetical protein
VIVDLDTLDTVPMAEVPVVLGELELAKAKLLARLTMPAPVTPAAGLLTLAAARDHLGVKRLPADLPLVRISPKLVRVRPEDLDRYVADRVVAASVYGLYSPGHDGTTTASAPQAARAYPGRPRRTHRRDQHVGGAVGAQRDRHLRARGPIGEAPGAANPPSEGDVDGRD